MPLLLSTIHGFSFLKKNFFLGEYLGLKLLGYTISIWVILSEHGYPLNGGTVLYSYKKCLVLLYIVHNIWCCQSPTDFPIPVYSQLIVD